jgi:peptidyl-prolyl cis-trans isomerase C
MGAAATKVLCCAPRLSQPRLMAMLLVVAAAAGAGFAAGRVTASGPTKAAPPAPPPVKEPAVARWSGGQLGAAQLQARVVAQKTAAGLATLDADRARAFADQAIRTAVLAAEARKRGLENDAQAEGPIADVLARRLVELELEDPGKRPPLGDAEIQAWFAAHRDEFVRPEQVRLSVLVGNAGRSDARARKQVRGELEALRQKIAALPVDQRAAAFADAARKRSDEAETAARGGDLGPTAQPDLEARLGAAGANTAWLMVSVGQLAIVETDTAIHLLLHHGRVPGREVTVEAARAQIESRIWYERRASELEKLVKQVSAQLALTVDEAALKQALAGVR